MNDEVKPWSFTDICKGLGILIAALGVSGGGIGTLIVSLRTHDKVENVQAVQAENRESILKGVKAAEGAEKSAKKVDASMESLMK